MDNHHSDKKKSVFFKSKETSAIHANVSLEINIYAFGGGNNNICHINKMEWTSADILIIKITNQPGLYINQRSVLSVMKKHFSIMK
ncbi:hypothetical protein ABES02_16510 [Neobacillus pocheonensis]|uniref:hypothetical protein n=1 Tax=Neobacillus pocheonensis TaxID=363869 RepID=UPI003D2BE1FF